MGLLVQIPLLFGVVTCGKRKMFLLLADIVVIILSMAEVVFVGVYWEYQKLGKENYISAWCNWITQQSPKLSNFRSSRNAGAIYRYDGRVSLSPLSFLPWQTAL